MKSVQKWMDFIIFCRCKGLQRLDKEL